MVMGLLLCVTKLLACNFYGELVLELRLTLPSSNTEGCWQTLCLPKL